MSVWRLLGARTWKLESSRPTNNLVGTVVGTVVGACLAPGLGNLQVLW